MYSSFVKNKLLLAFALVFLVSGCALFESSSNSNPSGQQAADQMVSNYYYSAFSDIPVPTDMKAVASGSFLVTSSDGGVMGYQSFKGRVDMTSLATYMQNSMQNEGWVTRSAVRFDKNYLMLFDKGNRFCIVNLLDSSLSTVMDVAVTPKISASATTSTPTASYGSGVQSLSQ